MSIIFRNENAEFLSDFDLFEMSMFEEDSHLDDDISGLIEQNGTYRDTTKKTNTDLDVWKCWCQSVKETKSFEDIPPEELDNVLSHYFIKVRRINGEEFQPGTLTSFQSSDDEHDA